MLVTGQIAYIGALWFIPLWLVIRAMRSRHVLHLLSKRDALLCKISLALLVATEIGVLFLGALLTVDNMHPITSFRSLPPFRVGEAGMFICLTSLTLCLAARKDIKEVHRLTRAIIYANSYLMFIGIILIFLH